MIENLKSIPSGIKTANEYHNFTIGAVSFIFFPNLIYPKKEAWINEGRKRIDIRYTNGKENGFYRRIASDKNIKANLIPVECKNYTDDIANAEFDQLLGRFDHNRGKLGLLLFRESENKPKVFKRCIDAAGSDIGIILPMDDEFIIAALTNISEGNRNRIDAQLNELYTIVTS